MLPEGWNIQLKTVQSGMKKSLKCPKAVRHLIDAAPLCPSSFSIDI